MAANPLALVKAEELLKEVRVDYYGKTTVVESAIRAVRELLLNLAEKEVKTKPYTSATIKDLGVPEAKAAFRFRKPDSVEIVGSFASQTVTKPVQRVDLAVRIPKACFHEKDFLNHRYFAKRVLYLAVLERALRKCPAVERIEWSSFCSDSRKPILVLRLAADETGVSTNFVLRLLPTISADVFDICKLALGRNNVREAKGKDGAPKATPFYNSGIVEDMLIEECSSWLQKGMEKFRVLRDAVSLSKVWLRQRSGGSDVENRDGLSGFLVSASMVHLSSAAGGNKVMEHMTSLQAFRATLEAIKNGNVLGKGIYLQPWDSNSPPSKSSAAKVLMKTSFDVVVCDPSGRLNLAHRMSKSALDELMRDAEISLEAIKGVKDGGFDSLFMTPLDFGLKFDYHVRLDPKTLNPNPSWCLDRERGLVYEKQVEAVLSRGLGERATLVRVIPRSLPLGWNPSKGLECVGSEPLYVGIILNNFEVAFKMADVGPDADNKEEAKKFRAFWGARSELRRFKDGKICETAVWECEPWKRHHIIREMVCHLLSRHLSLTSGDIKVTAGQLDFALNVREKDQVAVMPKLLDALDILSKRLRSIDNLPLKVVSVQPLSPAFRHTAVYYPQPHPLADESSLPERIPKVLSNCLDPLEVALQLEGSGRWPGDSVAIEKTKTAFCLKIADSLQQEWGVSCLASEEAVHLLMQGFAFRLSILYDKDPTHLSREKIASSLVKGHKISLPGGDLAAASRQQPIPSLNRDLSLRALHASVLYGLHGLYPAYGPTVRLAKRWLASHLLSAVLAEEAVELLVAYLFVRPAPFTPPSSRITGFLRFLQLIHKHDWCLAPLIVDINRELTPEDEERIQSEFDKQEQHVSGGTDGEDLGGKVPAMYIATAYDTRSETWTGASPSPKGLKRLVAYAKSSAALLRLLIIGDSDAIKWQSLFRTSLDNFDVVVSLYLESLPHPSRVLFPSLVPEEAAAKRKDAPKEVLSLVGERILKRGPQAARNHLLIGFDPITLFVDELKLRSGESCSIWYDTIGSNAIGLTFSNPLPLPEVRKVKRKKVENGHSNSDSLVALIEGCGEGLVKCIQIQTKNVKR